MPLEHGSSQAVVGRNIREMVHAGHPQDQAVAAAMRAARTARRQRRAVGGALDPEVGAHLNELGYHVDNPGGEWLARKQQYADEDAQERGGPLQRGFAAKSLNGASTASMTATPMLPVSALQGLKGVNNEHHVRGPGDVKFERLAKQVEEQGGFDPVNHPVFVTINHRGEPYIAEGNTRTALAHHLGVSHLATELRWFNGGEQASGPFSPENVARMSLEARRRGFGRGGFAAPEFGEGSGYAPEDIHSLTKLPIMAEDAPYQPGQRNVGEVGKDLVGRGQAFWKRRRIKDGRITHENATAEHNDALAEAVAAETEHALAGRGNAANWYSEKFEEAKRVAALSHPEIMHDPNALSAWAAALAITSQGEKVHRNAEIADQMYQRFKDNGGRFHMDGLEGNDTKKLASKQGKQMVQNFRKYDALIEAHGHDGAREFLNRPMKAGELKKAGYKLASGQTVDSDTHGSAIFGPKIGGGFYQNLMGNYEPVTQDLWFMRTFGRLTGTLMDTVKTEKGRQAAYDRFEDALKDLRLNRKLPTSKAGLARESAKWAAEHERNFNKHRAEYDSGVRTKDEIHHAAERLQNMLHGVLETPGGGQARQWRSAIVNRARHILQSRGHNITNADLQATIWYPEKDLWKHLGSTGGSSGGEGNNVDYSQAQQRLARSRGHSDDHIRQALGRELDPDEKVVAAPQAQPNDPRNPVGQPGPAAAGYVAGGNQGGGGARGPPDQGPPTPAPGLAEGLAAGGRAGFAEGGFPHASKPHLFHSNLGHGHHLHVGPIHSAVHGRTDHLPMHVPSGSYVLPADVVSAHGEGNTMAGFKVMRRLFGGAPYGGSGGPYSQGAGPYGEALQNSRGGRAQDGAGDEGVPIVAAGGEYVLSPGQVRATGGGDPDLGTQVLDEFVKRSRARNIKTLQRLPGPAKD